MIDLSPKQLIFVQEYIRSKNGRQAAIAAGYSEHSADSQASRMLKNDKVKQYLGNKEAKLDRDLREIFVQDAVKAYKVLTDIMNDEEVNPKERLVAARDLLDRAGYKPIERFVADIAQVVFQGEDGLED